LLEHRNTASIHDAAVAARLDLERRSL
jgi:hypothetical protein